MLCPFAMKHGTDSLITDVGQAVATYAVTKDVHATAGNVAISISTMREDTGLSHSFSGARLGEAPSQAKGDVL